MKADRTIHEKTFAKVGDIVYGAKHYDYGLASDDTILLGVEHKSVTLNKDGDYPFFTVPVADLELIND
jgi:hypothetical protein